VSSASVSGSFGKVSSPFWQVDAALTSIRPTSKSAT
jgi:hypothetical protein